MPDGQEIKKKMDRRRLHRRKHLDTGPLDPTTQMKTLTVVPPTLVSIASSCETVRQNGLITHGESSRSDAWVATDPNVIDSDGDSLPDGWEARYVFLNLDNQGINPLNGSDTMKQMAMAMMSTETEFYPKRRNCQVV